MLPSNSAVKSTAKASLKGRWPQAIGICFIPISLMLLISGVETLLSIVFSENSSALNLLMSGDVMSITWQRGLITLVSLLLPLFLTAPVTLGLNRFFWRTTGGADDTVGSIFYYFSEPALYVRSIIYEILFKLRIYLIGLICFLPAAAAALFSNTDVYNVLRIAPPYFMKYMPAVSIGLAFVGVLLFVPLMLRYYLAPFLLINDEGISPNDAFRLSARISKGSKAAYFVFILSFIGWFLLCAFALPILYVYPYVLASSAVFARYTLYAHSNRGNTAVIG